MFRVAEIEVTAQIYALASGRSKYSLVSAIGLSIQNTAWDKLDERELTINSRWYPIPVYDSANKPEAALVDSPSIMRSAWQGKIGRCADG